MSRPGSERGQAPFINTRDFARQGEKLEGRLKIAGFERLAAVLSGSGGELHYRLQGATDRHGNATLEVDFDTSVEVTCQRCLQKFELPVSGRNRFRLIDAEPEWSVENTEVAAGGDDEIVTSTALDVRALIEDEVLLVMPLAPRHEHCELAGGRIEIKRESPFGILAKLQKRH
jgi:uncharacterized protein